MRILAIDYAKKTGWAFSDGSKVISGVHNLKTRKDDNEASRFVRFSDWLSEKIDQLNPEFVFFEQGIKYLNADAALSGIGYRTCVLLICHVKQIGFGYVYPSQLKKKITGHGSAKKSQMIEWAKSKGYSPKDDNEADALAILHYAIDYSEQE